jgi:6-phosphogluconolactonase
MSKSEMSEKTRREFLLRGSLAAAGVLAAASGLSAATKRAHQPAGQRVFVASGAKDGIVAFDWDAEHALLSAVGSAAEISTVDWVALSPDKKYLFAVAEVESFNGRATGEVASFALNHGKLKPLSARNSASQGSCHLAVDATGTVLVAADYGGGSAASFQIKDGVLSEVVWSEHFTGHGPNIERQEAAHAHFISYSPDNRFVYVNDLGGDLIHIYALDVATAKLSAAGAYKARPGAGPRTLHFHPNGRTAYSVNELDSTVDVLVWDKANGSLTLMDRVEILLPGTPGPKWGCDAVLTRDGRFVYVAHRGTDFILSLKADAETGKLTPMERTPAGGKIPRSFVLDPSEKWLLVANQKSDYVTVFERNPETGLMAKEGRNFAIATPMAIVFV